MRGEKEKPVSRLAQERRGDWGASVSTRGVKPAKRWARGARRECGALRKGTREAQQCSGLLQAPGGREAARAAERVRRPRRQCLCVCEKERGERECK